ncbi:MAG: LPS assembly lipoprotein LptE [Cytophagales bacterium]|nr:LPS assembly lipoprotein LptE [Cytophagales bacterium]
MIRRLLIFSYSVITITACGVYSFTGANISPDIKTISIQTFYDEVGTGPPNLSQLFSEKIRDYYQQNTSLTIIDNEGDLQLEGSIVGYRLSPMAPRASGSQNFEDADIAALQRLTITVKVTYLNTQDDSYDFEGQNFSFFLDYDPEKQDFNSIEASLVEEIYDAIILDIFNASVANW